MGLVESLGFWDFTDVFEENRAGDTIFHGGFGLINGQGLRKPSYYGYWFLSRLGAERIAGGSNYIVTRKDDKVQILMWNYCHYHERFAAGDETGPTERDRYHVFEDKGDAEFSLHVAGLVGSLKAAEYPIHEALVFCRYSGRLLGA